MGESLVIGGGITVDGNIKIKILEVRRGVVRLGIDAPRDIPVFRDEIFVSSNQKV
jgi:carbon storage regulator CsrA